MYDLDSVLGTGGNASSAATPEVRAADPVRLAERVLGRYPDAYRAAGFLVGFGSVLKVLGVVLPVGIVLVALVVASDRPFSGTDVLITGLLGAVGCFVFFFVGGIMVSAQGQLIRALVDVAINTSPLLTNQQRASGMSL